MTAGCEETRRRIDAAIDGGRDVETCRLIDVHCASCTACAALVSGLRQSVGLCREAGAAPLPDEVRERARRQVRRLLHPEAGPD